MPALKERVDKHDREIAAIRKLILTGLRMISENAKQIRELRASQKETDRQLRETNQRLDRFIQSLERGNGNGHKTARPH